ncbi:serine/threonine-protein kinase [uncultured Roseobacter sp.]|uniref:serine/threonine protein kinase n=1 Tax=uncultured Roseobacter sp. TaxID=114847 RepID=UPI00260B600B|nr:serine/threonine-protein kinase [uncultured Roseobacter sp.]
MTRENALEGLSWEDELPLGTTLLNGQYKITGQLQRGGFAIAYIARNSLDREFVIKECFPTDMCRRTGEAVQPVDTRFDRAMNAVRRQFILEARRMSRLQHPGIVGVHQVFEENNTAYMALDMVQGQDLLSIAENNPERVTPAFFASVLDQMLDALSYTHAHGVLHRDISPDNILVDENDCLTLIDFGAASEHNPVDSGAQTMIAVKDGYSPHEFYRPGTGHDFSSDLYALGATLYHIITGGVAPDCQTRMRAVSDGKPDPIIPLALHSCNLDPVILRSIDQAMQIEQAMRFRGAEDWRAALDGETPPNRPPRPANTDRMLETRISELVTQINPLIETGAPGEKDIAPALPTTQSEPRRVVDIFGNPIDDVDAWLREQDAESTLPPARAPAADPLEDQAAETNPEPRKSLLGKLMSRCTGRR